MRTRQITHQKPQPLMLSDHIAQLQDLLAAQGDHPVGRHLAYAPLGAYRPLLKGESHLPKLEYSRVKRPRESHTKVWSKYLDKEEEKTNLIYIL